MKRPDWQCWPDFRVTVRPLPWTWRIKPWGYREDRMWQVQWLFLAVEWWGGDPEMFPMTEDPTDG